MRVMQSMAEVDPTSGRKVIKLGATDFEQLLQKEKDLFYQDTGYTCEQVSRITRENRLKNEESQLKAKYEAQIEAAKKMLPAADQELIEKIDKTKAANTTTVDEEDWEDEEDQNKISGPQVQELEKALDAVSKSHQSEDKVAKTVEI